MRKRARMDPSGGFTLIEVMTASLMILTLAALAYAPLRNYWFRSALEGGADDLISEVRGLQSRVTAESHPLVYGIRFTNTGNWMAEGKWGLVKHDPTGGPGGTPLCTQIGTGQFGSGLFGADVSLVAPSFTVTPETTQCRTNLSSATDQFAFLYARGTATAGTVTVHEGNLGTDEDIILQIHPLTGRIERL